MKKNSAICKFQLYNMIQESAVEEKGWDKAIEMWWKQNYMNIHEP